MNRTRDDLDLQVMAFYDRHALPADRLDRLKAVIGSTPVDPPR